MKFRHERLTDLASAIFAAAGCSQDEARRIAAHLADANLAGHDSHGVIRILTYVQWLREGKVRANRTARVVFENDAIAIVDGEFGYGQTVGEQAVRLGVEKCSRHGVAVIALRNSGHLGRIGSYPEQAAKAGKLSVHFVNTTGMGILVAPHGGINRRLSANPLAAGVPIAGGPPIILDMSTCMVAEGKVRVALNRGVAVPEGCLIDGQGRPTTDPKVFYADPGAILPIAGHKGHGLAILCDVLAGALTGAGCSDPNNAGRLINGLLSVYIDPSFFQTNEAFAAEVNRFVAWVKSASPVTPGGEILMPGEIEARTRVQRQRDGIDLDETTWSQIRETAQKVGVSDAQIHAASATA